MNPTTIRLPVHDDDLERSRLTAERRSIRRRFPGADGSQVNDLVLEEAANPGDCLWSLAGGYEWEEREPTLIAEAPEGEIDRQAAIQAARDAKAAAEAMVSDG